MQKILQKGILTSTYYDKTDDRSFVDHFSYLTHYYFLSICNFEHEHEFKIEFLFHFQISGELLQQHDINNKITKTNDRLNDIKKKQYKIPHINPSHSKPVFRSVVPATPNDSHPHVRWNFLQLIYNNFTHKLTHKIFIF